MQKSLLRLPHSHPNTGGQEKSPHVLTLTSNTSSNVDNKMPEKGDIGHRR